MGYKDLPPDAKKRFDKAHQTDGSEFHGTGIGAKILEKITGKNKKKNGQVRRIPVIPYDPNTEANIK